ncbi:hypothetical protein NS183_07775 [Microbacterium testaceum]|uniref:hypothetical protein n=1 Tax=Microbacterium testaceum TaxID=2033 RepID=UPI00073435AB|nr:hypothetical protein [Microbacterium testaceum]KTS90676.1 hypothetical protein NS183_07775 [Microbacterium testaceum]
MIGETVVIVRQVDDGEDAMGNPTTTTVEIPVTGCAFAPGASAESTATFGGRTDTDGTVYAPTGTVFLGSDMVRIRGVLYTVDGDAQQWTSPYTGLGAGVVVNVKRGS